MSKYTSGKTTQKRDKCIQRKSSEISALRTAAIADAAEIERLKAGHDRYEIVRTLNPRQFADLYAESIKSGVAFDELVDMLGGCNRE